MDGAVPERPAMIIPILRNHDHTKVIGKVDGNEIVFMPHANVTAMMLWQIFGNVGVQLLDVRGDPKSPGCTVIRARILEFSA